MLPSSFPCLPQFKSGIWKIKWKVKLLFMVLWCFNAPVTVSHRCDKQATVKHCKREGWKKGNRIIPILPKENWGTERLNNLLIAQSHRAMEEESGTELRSPTTQSRTLTTNHSSSIMNSSWHAQTSTQPGKGTCLVRRILTLSCKMVTGASLGLQDSAQVFDEMMKQFNR